MVIRNVKKIDLSTSIKGLYIETSPVWKTQINRPCSILNLTVDFYKKQYPVLCTQKKPNTTIMA